MVKPLGIIEVDGYRMGFEQAGQGPPVVLVHGYLCDGGSTWRPQLEGLSDEFTMVAWDVPGAGGSSDPPEDLGMAGYADCLASFIEAVGLDAPHLVGVSFGGALLIEFHRRHPRAAATLTLVSAYAGWRGSLGPEASDQRLRQAIALSALPPMEIVDTLLPTMFAGTPDPAAVEDFKVSLLATHPAGFRAMARAVDVDLRDALSTIDVPTLLIYGDSDVRAPLHVAEAMHAAIAGSKLVNLRGAGHV
jgi:pimeloyl-ACP methyl ester carboxylesterase